MMRIKEAIQRRKLIQQLNDEYLASHVEDGHSGAKLSCATSRSRPSAGEVLLPIEAKKSASNASQVPADVQNQQEYVQLTQFVAAFNARLSDGHRRALRVTWNRLSEPPKTSGRGMLTIMEKIFDQLIAKNVEVRHVFYKSAFLKCLEERRQRNSSSRERRQCRWAGTIVTVRDHAHLLIELIDGIMCIMFDTPIQKPVWDPATIGRAHARLVPFGFDKAVWHTLGEVFAEVMFCQECVRAYPHAASAWSMLSVALTDKMFRHTKAPRSTLGGNWSKQSSLASHGSGGACPDTRTMDALSAELQQRALITLRGVPGAATTNTEFSFRKRSLTSVQQTQNGGSGQKLSVHSMGTVGPQTPKINLRSRSASTRRKESFQLRRSWSMVKRPSAAVTPEKKARKSVTRKSVTRKSVTRDHSTSSPKRKLSQNVSRRDNRKLANAPSFFSRTLGGKWDGGGGASARPGAQQVQSANGGQLGHKKLSCSSSSSAPKKRATTAKRQSTLCTAGYSATASGTRTKVTLTERKKGIIKRQNTLYTTLEEN